MLNVGVQSEMSAQMTPDQPSQGQGRIDAFHPPSISIFWGGRTRGEPPPDRLTNTQYDCEALCGWQSAVCSLENSGDHEALTALTIGELS